MDKYRSIVCLNSNTPQQIIQWACQGYPDLPIIAIDGAANQLMAMNIKPHLVIGDLDSVRKSILTNCEIIETPDQNFSDFEKASVELTKKNLLPAIILGIEGGRLDHSLINVCILSTHFSTSVAIGDNFSMRILKEGESFFSHPIGTTLSIIPMPTVQLRTDGLVWDICDQLLTFPDQLSLSNMTKNKDWSIHVAFGCAALIVQSSFSDHKLP